MPAGEIPENTPEDVKKKVHFLAHEEVTMIRENIIYWRKPHFHYWEIAKVY